MKASCTVRQLVSGIAVFALLLSWAGTAWAQMSEYELRFRAMEEKIQALKDKVEGKGTDTRNYWDTNFKWKTNDGNFKFKFGGRIMDDFAYISESQTYETNIGRESDGTEFRRARFFASGLLHSNVKFKLQLEFADADVDIKDGYLGFKGIPALGTLQVGRYKKPFGLEELTSSKYITFMERSMTTNAFAAQSDARDNGISFYNHALDKRATFAFGVFRETSDTNGQVVSDDGYIYALRLTALPWKQAKDKLVHVGFGYRHHDQTQNDTVRFRARPNVHLTSNRIVNTGAFDMEEYDNFGFEGAAVYGPFSIQGEYMLANVDCRPGETGTACNAAGASEDLDFDGFYVQGSYWLTGEHRKYKSKAGAFSRVTPNQNMSLKEGGWGAWEIALRYGGIDLNDAGINGNEADALTVGLNWHWNKNTRIMFNYVRADAENNAGNDQGNLDTAQARFQIDF